MASKLGTLTLDLVCRVGNFTQAMREASGSASREMGRIEQSTHGVTSALKGMAIAAVGTFSVSQLSSYADSYIGLQNRLKLVTKTQQELTQATNDTYRIAQTTASSWDSTAQVYQRFAQNAKALGINLSQAASLTETVSKAISISGGTAASAEAALVQFGQALSSDVLRGEEFNSIAEQAGGLRDAIARGLNLSAGELRKWANDGKLTTDVVIKALENAKISVDELFNKTDFTGAQGWLLIQDAAMKTVGEFSKATGASKALFDSLKAVSENMDTVVDVMTIGAAYMVGSYIPAIYKSVAAKKAKIISTFEEIQAENAAIIQAQRKAQAEHTAAQAEMTRARDAVISAEMQVNADRAVIASEIQRMQSTIAATNVEKAQEAQRLRSQINDVGKAQSISRMAQLQQVQAIQVAELTALEAKLGATTLATSRVYEAARNTQTAATTRLTTATAGLNAANAMSARSSFSLLGALGGPVGLGLTVAAVAASYLLLKDSADKSTKSLRENNESVDDAIAKYRELDEVRRDAQVVAEREQLKELAKSYDNATDSLITNAYALTRHNDVTAAQSKELNALIAEFKSTGDLENFTSKIKALTFINQQSKDKFVVLAGAVSKAGSEYKTQQSLIEKMIKLSPNAVKATDERTAAADREKKAIEAANKAYADYSKSAFADIKEMAARKYFEDLGYSKNQINERLAVLKALDYNKQAVETKEGQGLLSLAKINAKMKDDEEARTKAIEEQNKQLKEQGKALQVNAKVQANAVKYDFAAIEKKYGLLNGLLSGIHMQESRGNGNAIGPMTKYGTAKGGFQFLDTTAKRFGLKGNDVFDIGKSADAAGQYLQYLYKKFGDWERAISAYHAGEGNVERGRNIGPVNRQYVKNIKGYIAGASGQAFSTDYTVEDYLSDLEKADEAYKKFQKDQDALRQQFSSEDVIRNQERIDTIAKANELGLQQYIPKIEEYYKAQGQLAHLHYIEEVNGYKWSEEQKIAHTRLVDQQQLILSNQYTDAEKKIVNKAIDDRAAYELAIFNETQRRKAQELSDVLTEQQKQSSRNQLRFIAQATMNPSEYARWNLQNNMTNDVAYAFEDYEKNVNNINRKDEAGRFEIEDANIRNQLLQQAERTHQAKMLEIKEDYAAQAKDLDQQEYETKMQVYGQIAGMVSQTFDQMAGMLRESVGESNALYKTMFLVGKSASIAQAIVNTEEGATKALAQGGAYGSFLAGVVRATGYASVGIMAGQTIAGMAHDGIDNVPREGTWLLDRGERVVDRRTNADLKDYLAKGGGGNKVIINNYGSEKVETSQDSDGNLMVTIGKMIDGAVDRGIQRNLKQGYPLSNAIKGR